MLKFNEFIVEGGCHVPVVSISRDNIDLSKEETRNEINQNFALALSGSWTNPYSGWVKIRKVLSMYNIFLPSVFFKGKTDGEEVVAIQQFGHKFGSDLSGNVTSPNQPDNPEYYLYYEYGIGENGFYEAYSVIVDEEELNDILDDDESDVDFEDDFETRDARQT